MQLIHHEKVLGPVSILYSTTQYVRCNNYMENLLKRIVDEQFKDCDKETEQ